MAARCSATRPGRCGSSWIPPDDQNRIPLACRCLLVRDGARTILFETGIGAFFEPAMRERFGVVESRPRAARRRSAALGVTPDTIDVVVLSHLHFDHAGGALTAYAAGATPRARVPARARGSSVPRRGQRAVQPHARDRASFIPGLIELLEATGRLELSAASAPRSSATATASIAARATRPVSCSPRSRCQHGPVVFAADLIPGRPWVHLPITMGYDRYPEMLIDEKTTLLTDLLARHGRLFFTHDPVVAMGTLARDPKGKFGITDELRDVQDLAS